LIVERLGRGVPTRLVSQLAAGLVLLSPITGLCSSPRETGFVTRHGVSLLLDGRTYRFDGVNLYNAARLSVRDPGLAQALQPLRGGEVVRAWFFQELAISDGRRDWRAFDQTLAVSATNHKKVIATLIDQWGACDGSDGYKSLAWYQNEYATRVEPACLVTYREWVSEVVTRYKNSPSILLWQLVNESEARESKQGICDEATAADALRRFTDDVGGLVHRMDPKHLVNLGTIGGGQCGTAGPDYGYVHASTGTDLCEYHDYSPPTVTMPGDEYNGIRIRIDQCNLLDKPLFVGETGITISAVASPEERARNFDEKFSAQFGAGVVGELIWQWNPGPPPYVAFDVGPGDPALELLTKY
jgi:mannan endo-1,4-beta-mannosidase